MNSAKSAESSPAMHTMSALAKPWSPEEGFDHAEPDVASVLRAQQRTSEWVAAGAHPPLAWDPSQLNSVAPPRLVRTKVLEQQQRTAMATSQQNTHEVDLENAFGSGVLYWNSSDLMFFGNHSRPSSVESSEDSSVGYREAVVGGLLGDQNLGFWNDPAEAKFGSPRVGSSKSLSLEDLFAVPQRRRPSTPNSTTPPPRLSLDEELPSKMSRSLTRRALRAEVPSARDVLLAREPRRAREAPDVRTHVQGMRDMTSRVAAERALPLTRIMKTLFAPTSSPVRHAHADAMDARRSFWAARTDSGLMAIATRLTQEVEDFCAETQHFGRMQLSYRRAAVLELTRALQDIWPRARTRVYGSFATGLSLPSSDVDVVVWLPPVRNLEPIDEAGILEGRNGIKETVLQQATRLLSNQTWVRADSVKAIENTAVPIISMVAVPRGAAADEADAAADASGSQRIDPQEVRLDVSFEAPKHKGFVTVELVRELTSRFPQLVPLTLVLKQFLQVRSLHHAYTGGLSSYCLLLLLTAFIQELVEAEDTATLASPGRLLLDFLHYYGSVFDARRTAVSLRTGNHYPPRDTLIDPLYIYDPLAPDQDVGPNCGQNCFRILQVQRAFQEARASLEGNANSEQRIMTDFLNLRPTSP